VKDLLTIVMTTYNSKDIVGANTRYYFEEELAKHCNLVQLGKGRANEKGRDEPVQTYLDKYGIKPDFVFSEEDTTGYKCGIQIDMHRTPYKQLNKMKRRKYDIMFITYPECPYAYVGTKHGEFMKIDPRLYYNMKVFKKICWSPHSVEPTMFYPTDDPPIYDVAFLGDHGGEVYPLRTRIYDELDQFCARNNYSLLKRERISGKVRDRRISKITRLNPTIHHPFLAGRVYAEALRRSRCFIFGSSIFKYPIKKWFEAGASRTLILADTPSGAERLHLEEWVTHVPINASNWKERVKWVFDNPEKADKIAETWYERVMRYHTNEVRAKEFIGQLEEFLHDQDTL